MKEIKRIGAGKRMSDIVIYDGTIYFSGVVADSAYGKGTYDQTKDVLTQIDEMLEQAGSDKAHILKANIWLTDMANFAEMNRAWDSWVVAGSAPVRATVEAKLADSNYAVEIMIEAAVK